MPDPRSPERRDHIILEGDVPSPANPPSGCRNPSNIPWKAQENLPPEEPALETRPGSGHPSACHFAEERDVVGATT